MYIYQQPPLLVGGMNMYPYSPNTEVSLLVKTVKEIRPSQGFSNSFYVRLKLKVGEFAGIFGFFFDHTHLHPVPDAPILCQMKGLMEIHKCCKFHEYTICDCQVINVRMFSDQQKVPFLGAFSWITTPNQIRFVQNFHQ